MTCFWRFDFCASLLALHSRRCTLRAYHEKYPKRCATRVRICKMSCRITRDLQKIEKHHAAPRSGRGTAPNPTVNAALSTLGFYDAFSTLRFSCCTLCWSPLCVLRASFSMLCSPRCDLLLHNPRGALLARATGAHQSPSSSPKPQGANLSSQSFSRPEEHARAPRSSLELPGAR